MASYESRFKDTLLRLLHQRQLPFTEVVIDTDPEEGHLTIRANCVADLFLHDLREGDSEGEPWKHPRMHVSVTFTMHPQTNRQVLSTSVLYAVDPTPVGAARSLFPEPKVRVTYNWTYDLGSGKFGLAKVRDGDRLHYVSARPPESICAFVALCGEAERATLAGIQQRELYSFEVDSYRHIEEAVNTIYSNIARKAIADVKALPDKCRQLEGNSNLKNVWDEFKYQIQRDESVFFFAYEDTIQGICAAHVDAIDSETVKVIWCWSEAHFNWDSDDNQLPDLGEIIEGVRMEVYNRVCEIASNEPFEVDPDEDRDRDRYERDREANEPDE